MIRNQNKTENHEMNQDLSSKNQNINYPQRTNSIKFKQFPQSDQPYLPKLKISAKQHTLSFSYIYKAKNFDNIEMIGNLDEPSSSQNNNVQIGIIPAQKSQTNILVTQAKKKGIKEYSILIKRKDVQKQTNQSSVLITSMAPFKNNRLLNYYQLKIAQFKPTKQSGQYPCFSFGITNNSEKSGTISIIFKFNKQGGLQVSRNSGKIEQKSGWNLKKDDVVGCGFIPHINQVFLTYNGKYVLYKFKLIYPQEISEKQSKHKKTIHQFIEEHSYKFYPYISIASKKIQIQSNFQNSFTNFVFPYVQQQLVYQQKLINKQIPKNVEMTEQSIYGLVLNYFKFYGYEKTGQLFEKEMLNRNMTFYPQNQPLRNKLQYNKKHEMQLDSKRNQSLKQKRIKKNNKKSRTITRRSSQQNVSVDLREQLQLDSSLQQRNSQEQNRQQQESQSIQQFYKLGKSSSIISRRGKKIIDKEQIMDETLEKTRKKQEEINFCLNKRKMEKKVQELKRSQQQKFKMERIQIIKNIQQGKIQKALKLYSKSFKLTNVVQIFFKAHLLLKYFQQQGLQKVLEYAKKEHQNFTQFQNHLMPFFNYRSLSNPFEPQQQFRPIRQILFLICSQNKQQFNFKRQMDVFSQFIGKIICEDIGYFSSSKLQIALEHYKTIYKKVSEHDIAIGGMDLQAMEEI